MTRTQNDDLTVNHEDSFTTLPNNVDDVTGPSTNLAIPEIVQNPVKLGEAAVSNSGSFASTIQPANLVSATDATGNIVSVVETSSSPPPTDPGFSKPADFLTLASHPEAPREPWECPEGKHAACCPNRYYTKQLGEIFKCRLGENPLMLLRVFCRPAKEFPRQDAWKVPVKNL